MTRGDALEDLVRRRVDGEDRSVLLARHVDDLAVRPDLHAFGLLADLHALDDVAGREFDDARCRRIFVGNVEPRAVAADRQLLGIVARVDDAFHLIRVGVDLADAVGGAVGRRQRLLVDAGWRRRRPAEGDVEELAVGTRLDAARPFPELIRADRRLRVGVDDRQVARPLVRHVNADFRRRSRGRSRLGLNGDRGFGRLFAARNRGQRQQEESIRHAHARDDTAACRMYLPSRCIACVSSILIIGPRPP